MGYVVVVLYGIYHSGWGQLLASIACFYLVVWSLL